MSRERSGSSAKLHISVDGASRCSRPKSRENQRWLRIGGPMWRARTYTPRSPTQRPANALKNAIFALSTQVAASVAAVIVAPSSERKAPPTIPAASISAWLLKKSPRASLSQRSRSTCA